MKIATTVQAAHVVYYKIAFSVGLFPSLSNCDIETIWAFSFEIPLFSLKYFVEALVKVKKE